MLLLILPIITKATSVSGIISSNTVWSASGSPYQLTGKVQITYGSTLTIGAGVIISGGDQRLENFGNLVVAGTQANPVQISNLKIVPGNNASSAPHTTNISFANIDGGSIWASNAANYGSLNIRDSMISNVGSPSIELWYPVANCTFERNVFIRSVGLSIGIGSISLVNGPPVGPTITIRNNVFYSPNPDMSGLRTAGAITVWANYIGLILVEGNSFLNIQNGIALNLPAGYSPASMTAAGNYWGGLSNSAISSLIFDKTKDLSSGGTITYLPVLSAPSAATPVAPAPPAITGLTSNQTLTEGGTATLTVTATGAPGVTYQWKKNGIVISGATNSTLILSSVPVSATGLYSVMVSNVVAIETSSAIAVNVSPKTSAPAITSQPISQFVSAGGNISLFVAVSGNPAPSLQWLKNGVTISGAVEPTFNLTSVSSTSSGTYSVIASNSVGSVTSSTATITVTTASALSNLSVRTTMTAGQTLTLGAVVSGGSKHILFRAAGPALSVFGLNGITDPRLELYTTGTIPLVANDDWSGSLAPTFTSVGAFAFTLGSKDAAFSQPLSGPFTVQAKGTGPGVILVEAYDIVGGTSQRLINVSARNQVGTGNDILIAGFAISGSGQKQVLIRAVGPTLSTFGVSGTLADPTLKVLDSQGVVLASNDDWEPLLSSTFSQVGAFPLTPGSKDAAVLLSLRAGSTYTVQVSGVNNGVGEALVEVYEVF